MRCALLSCVDMQQGAMHGVVIHWVHLPRGVAARRQRRVNVQHADALAVHALHTRWFHVIPTQYVMHARVSCTAACAGWQGSATRRAFRRQRMR